MNILPDTYCGMEIFIKKSEESAMKIGTYERKLK